MMMLNYAWNWVREKLRRDGEGAVAIEYVLVILAVALFLVVAAFGLQGVLVAAVSKVSTWIQLVNPPATP